MNPASAGGSLQVMPGDTAAFRQALRYALAAARQVTPELMPRPTPCRAWDLRMLLLHATDSLAALAEGLDGRHVGLYPQHDSASFAADPCQAFRQRARDLLGSCDRADADRSVVTVGGCPMAASLLTMAGALEIAVHGWDIARSCGHREPIPAPLAAGLLRVAPLLIAAGDRQLLFAAPVAVPATASPSDRLAAFTGRSAC
jgi:uncharacterized protein (TIGR03086 family)